MLEYIAKYRDTIRCRSVYPDVKPNYLRDMLPKEAPAKPEEWKNIMKDLDEKIMPGIAHWIHPHFFAYFPSGVSYPTILADMFASAVATQGFTWVSIIA